jgi:hypothetical protein
MHSYQNAREVNAFGTGNVLEHFKKMKNLISVNDGLRKFTPRTVTCHDQQAPFWENEQTYLSITHKDHHVSHITDGFIHMIIEVMLQLRGIEVPVDPAPWKFDDPEKLCKLFVGFKDSNQIFKQMWIRTRNHDTGYEQSEMCREGFAMGHSMDFNSKKSKKYTHTLYDNVSKYNESVCGTFIDIQDFRDGQPHPVQIELIIPLDDLASLQAFAFYPNKVVGDLELSFYVGSAGLVWCPIDPVLVGDVYEILQGQALLGTFGTEPRKYSHQFAQINNSLTGFNEFKRTTAGVYTMETGNLWLACVSMRVLTCEANMSGFQVRDSTLQGIAEIFSTPVNIPAEYLEYNAFPTQPDENGLRSTLNTMLNNVKDIYVMFPKRTNDVTCFDNPCIDQFCIRCLGTQYPEKVVSTLGPRFYQYSLIASDLGGHLRPTTEFVDAYTQVKNSAKTKVRYTNTLRDGSSFALIVQTERNESGYVFDGLDSEGQSTPIDIQFTPLVKGLDDTYYYFDAKNPNVHPPAPQIWLCRNVYWSVDTQNGLVFHKYGTPEGLEIDT